MSVCFQGLPLDHKLFPASIAVFRRQWNALLDHLEIPRRQLDPGVTPGTLRGSGATHWYLMTEDIPKIAWRGRWSKVKTLEHYIQEVSAQLFLHSLSDASKHRIRTFESHCDLLLKSLFAEQYSSFFARQNFDGG